MQAGRSREGSPGEVIPNNPIESCPKMFPPQAGKWYIVTTCEKCRSTIFLFADLTAGRGSLKATYIITCPHCNHKGSYEGRHYQHQPQNMHS